MNLIALLGFFLFLSCTTDSSLLDPVIENVRHIKATHPPEKVSGMWKKKMLWKPRWIKEWKSSNVLKPIWRKFWGPVIIREWVPIPKPPPQWDGIHAGPAESHSPPPEAPFLGIAEPPAPNFSYLQRPASSIQLVGPASNSYQHPKHAQPGINALQGFPGASQTNYKVPHLPITSGYQSLAETYSGQSSYGSNKDNSAYDLNPPVEQFNPGYGYRPPSGNHGGHHAPQPVSPAPVKPALPHSHIHHHNLPHYHRHQHHLLNSNGHTYHSHGADLTKFPPDWNSWESQHPKAHSHSSGLAQASSAVSIVSKVQSTTQKPQEAVGDHLISQGFLPADNEFIQQAALVSEYHYTEHALQNPTSAPPLNTHVLPSFIPNSIHSSGPNENQSHVAVPSHPSSSLYVSPLRPAPVQPTNSSIPPPIPAPIVTHKPVPNGTHRPPSIPINKKPHAAQHKTPPPLSHNPKYASSPIPSQTPTSALPFGPKPNHPKIPPTVSFHRPNPVTPHRPMSGQAHPPTPTRNHTSHSSSPPAQLISPATVHSPATSQVPPDRQNAVHPRKPGLVPSPTLSGPPRQPNSSPPKKTAASKPEFQKDEKALINKHHAPKVPDFKALPSTSVEAFHFIEGFPSNQTLTRAALVGNVNQGGVGENQVEIIAARPHQKDIPPYVAKLAEAIVGEHLKKAQKVNLTATEPTTSEAPTERATVTFVYPSTNPFVRKTLKAYLADESSAEKSTKVFVVTPVPHTTESSMDVSNRV